MTVPAFPAPDEIVEDIRMQIGAVGPPALLPQLVAVREQLGTAGRFGQQLHAAGAFELQCKPYRLLDAAAGGDDAMVAGSAPGGRQGSVPPPCRVPNR